MKIMKKIFVYTLVLGFLLSFSACQEEFEPGGTPVQEMAGTYTVLYNHDSYGTDPFGAGYSQVYLYNTSSESTTEMWLSDLGNFWEYKVKLPINLANLTFGSSDTLINAIEGYDIKVIVENGIIIPGAATPPSETPVDSIYFDIWFDDLGDATGIEGDRLRVSGFRYTGWPEDE